MLLLNYQIADTVNFSAQVNYYVGDYSARNTSNGEVLKVPIQGEECFLIVNRGNASKWDKLVLGDTTQIIGPYEYNGPYSKGVYIYHVKSDGIIYPNGSNIHVQDLECADGVWYWSNRGQAQRYAWDKGYCFNASLWSYYLRESVSYSNDQGWNYSPADGISHSFPIWAGVGAINTGNACQMGTDRIFTNKSEIFANEEVLGDRYDAWRVGYNEIFSPYSSPNTNTMSNDSSGIFIYLYSSSGSGPQNSAALKIYKAGQGEFSKDSILYLTPPSRPMGIVVDYFIETENYVRPLITWNHNREPDMLSDSLTKRYKIWRATATNMNIVPTNYTLLKTLDIDSGTAPCYLDTSIKALGSAWPGMGEQIEYPVRYTVQAIDKYADSSVRSDFGSIIGLMNCFPCTVGERMQPEAGEIPDKYKLYENYPNPFNPETKIKFDLPIDNYVTLIVYDILGKEIFTLVNEFKQSGRYVISFNGNNLSSGIYYYKIKAGSFEQARKMILLK